MAEGIRIRAEGVGAEAEIRRENARMAAMGDGGYGSVQVAPQPGAEAETEKAAAPVEKKAPPPQPVYVVVPAY